MGDRKNKKAIQQSALAEDIWGAETTQDVSAASIPETSIAADIWDEEATSSPLASADTDIPKPEPAATTQEYTNKLFGKDVQGRPIVPATPPVPAQPVKVDPQERLKKATETIASDYISMRGAPEGIDINNPENPLNQVTSPTADPAYIGSYIQGRMSDIDADYRRRQHEIQSREMSGAPVFGERQQAKTEYEAKKKDLFENAGHIVSLQLFNKEYGQQKPSSIHSDIAMDARLKEHQSEIQDIDDQIRATKTWAHPNGIEAVQERKSLERKKELLQETLQSDAAKIKQNQKFNPILLGAEYHAAFGDKNATRDIELIRQGKPVNPARQYAYNQIGNTIIEEGTAASVNENAISEGASNIDVGGERLFENNKPFILEQARMAVANKKYQKENALLHAIVPSAMLPDISKEEIKAIGEEAGLSEKVIKEIQADPSLIPKSTSLMQQFARGALNTAAPIYEQGIRALARLSPDGDMEFVEEHFQPGWESQRGLGAAIAGNNPTEQNSFRNFRGAVGQIMEGAGGLATFAGEVGIVGKELAKLGVAATQADKLANFSVMAFNGYNDAYHTSKEVIGEDPKDEGKRQLYSLINGIAAGAIFSISPQAELVKKALGMETKSGRKLLEEIQKSKGIEFLSTKQGKATITDYVREFLKENGKQVGLATTVKIAEQITNAIANPEMKQDVAEDIKNTAISTALAMFLPSVGGAFGHVRGKTPLNSAAVFEVGTHPEEYISHVSDLLAEGKISAADAQVSHDAILNMKKAISATPTKNADGKDLSPNQIKDYAYSLLQESIIQKQADKITESAKALNITPDKAQVDPLKERISALQQERLQMMENPQEPTVEAQNEVEADVLEAEEEGDEAEKVFATFEEEMRFAPTMYEFYEGRLKDENAQDWQKEDAKEYLEDPIAFLEKGIEAAKNNLERDPEDNISRQVLSRSEKELELVRKIVEKHQGEKPERSVATDGQSEEIARTEKKSPEKVAEIEEKDIPLTSTETPATEVATENVIVEPPKNNEDASIKDKQIREDGSEIGETEGSQERAEIRQAADSEGRIQPEETGQLSQGKKPRQRIKLEPEQPEVVAQAIPFAEPPKVESKKEAVLSYEEATKLTTDIDLSKLPEGVDEQSREARSQAARDMDKTGAKFNEYPEGTYAVDRHGDLHQLQEIPIEDLQWQQEGTQRSQTVDKYAEWISETGKMPPLKGVENYAVHGGKVVITDGRHRIMAAKKAGLKKVPVWVSLTDPRKITRALKEGDIAYHTKYAKNKKDATEISKGKEQVSDKQSGEAERPRTEPPAGKEAAPQAGGGNSVKRGKGKSKEKVEEKQPTKLYRGEGGRMSKILMDMFGNEVLYLTSSKTYADSFTLEEKGDGYVRSEGAKTTEHELPASAKILELQVSEYRKKVSEYVKKKPHELKVEDYNKFNAHLRKNYDVVKINRIESVVPTEGRAGIVERGKEVSEFLILNKEILGQKEKATAPTKPKRKGKVWNPDVYMKRRKVALENEASSIEEHLLGVMLGMDDKNPTGKWRYGDVEKELPSRSVVGNKQADGDPFAPRREVIPEEKRIAKQFTHKDGKSIDKWADDLAREIEDGHHPFGLDGMDSKGIADLIKSMVSRFPSKHALLEHLENLHEGRKEKDPSQLSEADYIASRQLIDENLRKQKEWEDEDARKIEEQIHQEIAETKDKLSEEDVDILDNYLQKFVKDGIYDDSGIDVFSDEFQSTRNSLSKEGQKIFDTIIEGGSGNNTDLVKEIISKADVNRKKDEAANEQQQQPSTEADSGDATEGQGGDTAARDGDKPDVKAPTGETEAGGEAKRELIKSISDKLRQAAKKAPDAIRKIAKSMGISANWDMAGEGDFLSGKSGEFGYTQRRLGQWNRQSQLGEINPKSEITYKSNDDKKRPYISAVDENGVQIGELATSQWNDGVLRVEHLVVAPEFRGKGVAEELYNRAREMRPDIDLSVAEMQSEGYVKFAAPIAIAERYAREKESGIDSEFTKAVESVIKVEKEAPDTILSRKQKRHEELSLELDELKGDRENLEAQLESAYATSTPDAEFIDRVEQAIREVSADIEAKERQVKIKQKEIDAQKVVVKNAAFLRKQAKKIEDSSRGMIGSMPGVSPKIAAEILRKVADLYEGLGNVYVAAIRAAEWAKQQFKGENGIGALSDVHVRELISAYTEPQKAEPIIKNKQHLESAREAIEDIINGDATLEQVIEEVMDNADVSDKTKANILNYIDWHIQGRDYHNDISLREKQYEDSYYDEYAMSGTGRETNYLSEQTLKDVTGQDVLARETAEALSIENISKDAANLAGLAKNKYGDDIMQWGPSMLEDIRKSKSDDPVKKVAALTGLAWELRMEKQRNPSRELQVDKVLYQVEREWKETLRSASKTLNAARANRLFRNEHYADMYAEQIMSDKQREGKRTYENVLSDQKRMDEVSEKYEKEGVLRNEAEAAKEEAIKAEKAKKAAEAKAEKEKEGKKSPVEKIRDVFRKSKKDSREAKPKEYYKEQAEKTAKEMGKAPDKFMEELKAKIKSIKC